MTESLGVPPLVRQNALDQGAAGRAWLDGLGPMIGGLEREWHLTVGPAFAGGNWSFVAPAQLDDGTPAVLKLAMPASEGQGDLRAEIEILTLADGAGCARLFRHDLDRRVLLLERLGRHLSELDLPVRRQLEIICSTLQEVWSVDASTTALASLADKGPWLAEFIGRLWEELDRPCSAAVVDRARSFVERRMARFDPERAVLLHGDAHPCNTLEDPASPGRFKFVDPDGLTGEREYDLAIPMRELNDELLAGDALQLGLVRCRVLSELTGTDPDAIWEWGFVERVSSGLFLWSEGQVEVGRDFLQIAEIWASHASAS